MITELQDYLLIDSPTDIAEYKKRLKAEKKKRYAMIPEINYECSNDIAYNIRMEEKEHLRYLHSITPISEREKLFQLLTWWM